MSTDLNLAKLISSGNRKRRYEDNCNASVASDVRFRSKELLLLIGGFKIRL